MKKLRIFLVAAFTITITSCGGGGSTTPTTTAPPPTTTTPPPTPIPDISLDTAKWGESNWG
jgi:hypothetical protein